MSEKEFSNRLSKEKSPYLLQHAYNPVDWYPWGEEAFQAARDRDIPIFLSIGYATCHWCHVMERESFEDLEVAMALNQHFICIKVDREEMPDVDSLYMEFAQTMLIGAAGWPLNLMLTPDLKPFFASTYIPKHSSVGMVGILELIQKIHELWTSEARQRLTLQSEKIVEILRHHVHMKGKTLPLSITVEQAQEILFKIADPVYGGMRGSPKFPLGYQANFLLRSYLTTKDARALFLVEKTLDMMHRGGIYDHLGGGFSRYSTDEKWLVPHFEKMLYDNALLALGYLEAWRITRRTWYRTITDEILGYVMREMTHPDGGFYSAEDAESDGIEGHYYTWTKDELMTIVGAESGELILEYFGVDEYGNFADRSVLSTYRTQEEFAQMHGLDEKEWSLILQEAKKKLFHERQKRTHPFKDKKILTGWNGMMIRAFAEAGHFFFDEKYIEVATKAAGYIRQHVWKNGELKRRCMDGEVAHHAVLDDYAYLISGLLSLFEATGDGDWIAWAMQLADVLERDFKELDGAFFQSDGKDTHLLIRKCQFSDGAEPSGNAVHAENLLRLYQLTADRQYLVQAEDIFRAVKQYVETYSLGYCYHLTALLRYYDKKKAMLVIVPGENKELVVYIQALITKHALLHHMSVQPKNKDALCHIPLIANKVAKDNKTTLYICREGFCSEPLTDIETIEEAMRLL